MPIQVKQHVRPLIKRGGSLTVQIPRDMLARLGWNRYDNIALEVVEASLVLTKVRLPSVEHLRRSNAQEGQRG